MAGHGICLAFLSWILGVSGRRSLVVPLKARDALSDVHGQASFLTVGSSRVSRLDLFRARHENAHAIEYFGEVTVGGQSFSVLFDTGSDQLAIPGTSCQANACKNHRIYQASKSKTVQVLEEEAARELAFGTGTVRGFVKQDEVCLASACAHAQFVEAVEESDDPFLHAQWDGVLGLSLQLRSGASARSNVLDALVRAGTIPRALFAVFMAKDLEADTSEITFGSSDASKAASETTWVPLSDPGYWQFSLADIVVGNRSMQMCANVSKRFKANTSVSAFFGKMCCRGIDEFEHEERCQYSADYAGWRSTTMASSKILASFEDGRLAVQAKDGCVQKVPQSWLALSDGCRGDGSMQAILDTGSSLMMAPDTVVDKISAAIGVREDCTGQALQELPKFSFRLPSGRLLTLGPDDYMDTIEENGKNYCWLHLMRSPSVAKGPLFVLGLPFLRAHYTTFDAENRRVGFAVPRQPKRQELPRGSIALRGWRPSES
mmetsp:Transcript_20493/g.36822  ORF Transcript_20493/g.36822 Transcript_20493/m.36822 type:complete len:490 (-) Transcript_20493:33-1502(-)